MSRRRLLTVAVICFSIAFISLWILVFSVMAQAKQEKVIDTEFVTISSYLVLMTIFDVETTFAAIRNGAHEANGLMRPFIKNGRLATYGMQLGIDALAIWLAYEMKGSKHKEFRKTWWLVPSVIGTGHGIAGGLNCRYIW